MKASTVIIICFMCISCIRSQPNKRVVLFKTVQKCAKEHGLDFKTASGLVNGDFSQKTQDAKVIMKFFIFRELQIFLPVLFKMHRT